MTRFLPRIWDDPEFAASNRDTLRLFAYHQATKHTYNSVRANARQLDWRNQPDPFRRYDGVPEIPLTPDPGFSNAGALATMALLAETVPENLEPICLDAGLLSQLLWHSMAVSAWKKIPGSGGRYSLRVNPSSGNLHPTEVHLAVNGFAGIGNGLYHYRADRHSVELRGRGEWTRKLAEALALSWAGDSPLIVGLTSIFWRESWKYGKRAYRYCCHDLGHALMSLLLAARGLGLRGGVAAHFGDARLARELGIAASDEAPVAFLVFPPLRATLGQAAPFESSARFELVAEGKPNELSEREVSYELLRGIHAASCLPDTPGHPPVLSAIEPVGAFSPERPASDQTDLPIATVVRHRRSALDFDAATAPMRREDLERLLDVATRDWRADWRGNFGGDTPLRPLRTGVDLVELYLYVHRVEACDPGVYLWDSRGRELRKLHSGNVQRVAAFLSLEQPLAGNACFSLSMIADLDRAALTFGNRGYRYALFEAGAIGQRLYVGAESLGWNATGIGAFYDDDVHRYLGFLAEREPGNVEAAVRDAEKSSLVMLGSPASREAAGPGRAKHSATQGDAELQSKDISAPQVAGADSLRLPRQVIYHFAVGRAIPDPRLEA